MLPSLWPSRGKPFAEILKGYGRFIEVLSLVCVTQKLYFNV